MNANFETSPQNQLPSPSGASSAQGGKSWWRLDFKRSPDVIFAVGLGLLAIYYGGLGVVKLIHAIRTMLAA